MVERSDNPRSLGRILHHTLHSVNGSDHITRRSGSGNNLALLHFVIEHGTDTLGPLLQLTLRQGNLQLKHKHTVRGHGIDIVLLD